MISFLRRVCEGNKDEDSHRYFVRFGKGRFEKKFMTKMNVGKKIKLKASFELANDFVKFAAEINGGKTSGVVFSKKQINDIMSKNNIQGNSERKNGGLFYKNNIAEQELSREQILMLVENSYFSLLEIENNEFFLKIKKALPKPGKGAEKVDDGFCVMELDLKYLPQIKETFFWDMPDAKKIQIEHILEINEIILPENEKDPVKLRENAIRKGKLIRKAVIDGNEIVKGYEIEA